MVPLVALVRPITTRRREVAATIEQDGDSARVTLTDDGDGIADPAVLLTFGESDWKAGIAEAEDPAGFGLLALSRRGCTLRWRTPGGETQATATASCSSPLTFLAVMRPMSSRTTAPPGPMEPRLRDVPHRLAIGRPAVLTVDRSVDFWSKFFDDHGIK